MYLNLPLVSFYDRGTYSLAALIDCMDFEQQIKELLYMVKSFTSVVLK